MKAPCKASLAVPKPSSRQTTLAAGLSHRWSTMVPHLPSRRTSTRPSPSLGPAFSRTGWTRQPGQRPQPMCKVQFWPKCHFVTQSYHHCIWSLGSSRGDASKLRTWYALDHHVSAVFAGHRTSGYRQLSVALRQTGFTAQTVNFFHPKSLLLRHEAQSVRTNERFG